MADAMKMCLTAVQDGIEAMGLGLDASSPRFKTAVLLMSTVFVGTDVRKLSQFTTFSERWIVERVVRLKRAGVWTNKGLCTPWLDETSSGDIADNAFLLDICIAEGEVVKN